MAEVAVVARGLFQWLLTEAVSVLFEGGRQGWLYSSQNGRFDLYRVRIRPREACPISQKTGRGNRPKLAGMVGERSARDIGKNGCGGVCFRCADWAGED